MITSEAIYLDAENPKSIHLGFIDSLRALAALYVVLGHVFSALFPYAESLRVVYPNVEKIYSYVYVAIFSPGHLAVAVFIVISGFCLMIPLARKGSVEIVSIKSFIKRRALRILPPYYAALGIALLLMIFVPRMNDVSSVGGWADAIPAFGLSTIGSHLLLIHHWSDQWICKINPPLWSIGVEWQMYFLMPLLFLPLLGRLGRMGTLATTAILGAALTYGGHGILPEKQYYIHFIALFAAGMVTAQVCFSPSEDCRRLRQWFPAAKFFWVLFALIVFFLGATSRQSWNGNPFIHLLGAFWDHFWPIDYVVTACFCCLLIALCQETIGKPVLYIKKFLSWAPLVFVGHFSYSIYLIHDPFLRLACTVGEYFHLPVLDQYLFVWIVGFPFSIFCGYLLYLAVERHFIKPVTVGSR